MGRVNITDAFYTVPFVLIECGVAVKTVSCPVVTERRAFGQNCDGNRNASHEAQSSKDVKRNPEPILDRGEDSLVKKKNGNLSQHDGDKEIRSSELNDLLMRN